VLGAIFGKAPEPKPAVAAPPAPSTTSASSTAPAPVTYTIGSVTDGATVVVNGSDGTSKTMHILGATSPGFTTGCYFTESLEWATTTLSGKAVTLGAETAHGITMTLADGQDYATLAIQKGYLKYATDAALPALAGTAVQRSHRRPRTDAHTDSGAAGHQGTPGRPARGDHRASPEARFLRVLQELRRCEGRRSRTFAPRRTRLPGRPRP